MAVQTPLWLDLAAVFASAVMGALVAVRRDFDVVGVLALALVTGLGGGVIRDVLLNQVPVFLHKPSYPAAAIAAAALAFYFAPNLTRIGWVLLVSDAIGLGLYGVVGADKALVNGIDAFPAVLVGIAAAVGGGVLRDVLTAQPPAIFRRGELYALTALAGIVLYVALDRAGLKLAVSAALAVLVTTGLRIAAVRRGWRGPVPVDAVTSVRRSVSRRR
jgi:uncharacterized membrane protein YeiH